MQGHIHKRVRTTKDGRQTTTWYVVVELHRGSDGRRRQKWHGGFRTRKEAEAAKAKLVNEINTGGLRGAGQDDPGRMGGSELAPDDAHPGQAEHLGLLHCGTSASTSFPGSAAACSSR